MLCSELLVKSGPVVNIYFLYAMRKLKQEICNVSLKFTVCIQMCIHFSNEIFMLSLL